MDYLRIFRNLEQVSTEQNSSLHNAVKSPVADLHRALTKLLLYNEESRLLVGQEYAVTGEGTSSGSTSGGSDSTLPLSGQRVAVSSAVSSGDNSLTKLLSKRYYETLKSADAKAVGQLELMNIEKFLNIELESWNHVLENTQLAKYWTPLYQEIVSAGTAGRSWDPFELFARLKKDSSPSISELRKMRSDFSAMKQGNLTVPLFAGKLKAKQEEINGILNLFKFSNWTVGKRECLIVLLDGMTVDSRKYVLDTIFPSICSKEQIAPGDISFDMLYKEFPKYSFEHIKTESVSSLVPIASMSQKGGKMKPKKGNNARMPTGTDSTSFMKWVNANPGKCFFCLQEGHRYYKCPIPPDKNRKYPKDHPLNGKGMSDAIIAALSQATRTIQLSRMNIHGCGDERVIHDTGCEGITVVGSDSTGIDLRNSSRSLVKFQFGGGPIQTANALVGMLYLQVGDTARVMRTPAVFNDQLNGIFLANKSCVLDGGIKVQGSNDASYFYELVIPTFRNFDGKVKHVKVGVDKDSSRLCSTVKRLSQEEIERVEKVPLNLNILGELKCEVAPMEHFELPGRPVGLYPTLDASDVAPEQDSDNESILETDEECEDENLGKLSELHMRCNHRAPEDLKRMSKEGLLDVEWNSQLENEMKDFHCEACAAVRLKNQKRRKRRKGTRASRPLQIIRMDTIPCPTSVDENDEIQKLLLRLPPRSTPSIPKYSHILLMVDEYSRMKWALPLYSKSAEDVSRAIEKWTTEDLPLISSRIVRHNPQFDRTVENLIVELNSDHGTEFSTVGNTQSCSENAFLDLCKRLKVAHHVSMPDQQWQNGVVEGQVGVLKENAIISLRVAQAEVEYFPMAFMLAVDCSNRLAVNFDGKSMSPYERMFGEKPEISILPIFLQMIQYKTGGGGKNTNGSRSEKGYFLGLKENKPGPHGIMVYNPTSKRTVVRQQYKVVPIRYEIMWSPKVNLAALNAGIAVKSAHQLFDFSEADKKEIDGIIKNGTFGPMVDMKDLDKSKVDVVDTKMVRECKKDGSLKSRLVARGFSQQAGVSYQQTFVATPMMGTILICLAVAVQFGWRPFAADCTRAFLQPEVPEEYRGTLCIKLPHDLDLGSDSEFKAGQVRELRKLIYGCKQSGRIWQDYITGIMLDYPGMSLSKKDQSLFLLRENGKLKALIIIMIDDILCLSDKDTWTKLFAFLQGRLEITGGEGAKVWNGLEFSYLSDGSLMVSQSQQVSESLKNLELGDYEAPMADTPEDVASKGWSSKEHMNPDGLNGDVTKLFQSVLGTINYLGYKARPDLAHAISRCGQVASAASETNLKALLRCVGYLMGRPDRPITFRKGSGVNVAVFTDAGHAGEEFTTQENDLGGKSTSGYVVLINGGAVIWKSKLQSTVADSTGYAENLAAYGAIKECVFVQQLLKEMDIQVGQIPLFTDATNTVSTLLHNSSYKQSGTRHHKLKVSAMYQYVKQGVVHPICISSVENIADVLTKSVMKPKELFFKHTDRMFGVETDFEDYIVKLIQGNFSKFRNDKVPKMEEYIKAWLYPGVASMSLDH